MLLALGTYPEITLKEARDRRDQARKLLANDVDPGDNKKAAKAATTERTTNSFEVIAREWFAGKTDHMVPGHRKRIIDCFSALRRSEIKIGIFRFTHSKEGRSF
ncbi:MAG: integrase arm-type DNA-binding domain-containing protein [Candidatus Riflebacteria bacterium]|nr:integrase arm-type DNA-binding domain-containing protein [Candidatus Riflebacteria bacterium]